MRSFLRCPACDAKFKPVVGSHHRCDMCKMVISIVNFGEYFNPLQLPHVEGDLRIDIQRRLDFFATAWAQGVPEKVTFRRYRVKGAAISNTLFAGMRAQESVWDCCTFVDCDFAGMFAEGARFPNCTFKSCKNVPDLPAENFSPKKVAKDET